MAKLVDELRSGKCSIYAQWLAIAALIPLVVLPFSYIGLGGLLFIWSVMSWVVAALVLIIEFPLFGRCLPTGSAPARLFSITRRYVFRAASYFLFAVALGLSVIVAISQLMTAAFMLAGSGALYAVAVWRGEDAEESCLKGTAAAPSPTTSV